VKTVLFVGAGRHQRRAIEQARAFGIRVVAVDRNRDAPGLAAADIGEAIDFTELDAVTDLARRHGVGGVLTVAADRAVPIVAAISERLGLPSIGTDTARRMTHKIAMRTGLAGAGIPQPAFKAARSAAEAEAALEDVGLPAVLKPVDASGQRGLFLLDRKEQLERCFPEALAASSCGETILEAYSDGVEVNCMVVVRNGEASVLTVSDRVRPSGIGFGVALAHVYPSSLHDRQRALAENVAREAPVALGLRDGIAYPQLLAGPSGAIEVVEVAARIPGGQMGDVVRHGAGIDLLDVALRQALGEHVPDELALPRISQPLAIRFLTASPGPLPTGRVVRIGSLDDVLASEGVVQADTYLQLGEIIRPVQRDGDRRGYVIAVADTPEEALRRAEDAASKLRVDVEAAA
jgi:biotin carboxylase